MATTPLHQLPATQTAGTITPTAAADSTAGNAFALFASDAIAGTTNAGAAAGGPLSLEGGDAKRLTSGNANGGDVIATPGAAIGSGAAGTFIVRQNGGVAGTDEVRISHTGSNGLIAAQEGNLTFQDGRSYVASDGSSIATAGSFVISNSGVKGVFRGDGNGTLLVSGIPMGWVASSSDVGGSAGDTTLNRLAAAVVGVTSWLQNTGGRSRVTTSDVTNATTTMAPVTGLSATLIAGRKYSGKLILYVNDSVAADGIKVDFDGGTATMTSFRAHGTIFDAALLLSSQTTAIATDFVVATITGDAMVEVYFSFVCNGAGTFIPRFAKNAHTTGTATVYVNSFMWLDDMP